MNPPIDVLGAVIGAFILASAMMVVTSKVPIHAACFLIVTLFGVAAEYVVLEAHALAVFQVLIYAGAIVVMIAFVMMLMGSGPKDEEPVFLDNWRAIVGLIMSFGLLVLMGYALSLDRIAPADTSVHPINPSSEVSTFGSLDGIGEALLGAGRQFGAGGYLLPFEIISMLLLVAIVGAVALLRKRPTDDQEEVEQ